jgi:hypothetical protein
MSLLKQAAAKSNSRKPRDTEELLALIQADESTIITVAEAMRLKAAFLAEGSKLPYFEDPADLVSHVHALLS